MTNEEVLEIIEKAIGFEKDSVARNTELTDYARGAALSSLSNLLVTLSTAFATPIEEDSEE